MQKRKERAHWVPNDVAATCFSCEAEFTFARRRHHCRQCGGVFCGACSSRRHALPGQLQPILQRVCIGCFEALQKHQTTSTSTSPTGKEHKGGKSKDKTTALTKNFCEDMSMLEGRLLALNNPHQTTSTTS
eukprot:PhM_4_TR16799/c0_g1_i3/m.50500